MSDQPNTSDLEYSRQLQEKFELYLLGLTFTLLGLAVQTAKFGTYQHADILELLGWLALLISGLIGLSRLEWLPVAYKTNSHLVDIKTEHVSLIAANEQGIKGVLVIDQPGPADIQVLIADRVNAIKKVEARVSALEKSILRKYTAHKWIFVLGLTLLVMARGYSPTASIVSRHLTTPSSGPEKVTLSRAAEVKR
jgi:hypothetical protein